MAGRARPITLVGTPVLHRACKPVEEFGPALAELVDDMFASMYEAEGVGLAANQIGVDLRVFVYDCPDEDGERHKGAVVNPVLELPELEDRRLDDGDEGCLSVPGPHASVPRPDRATVHGFDVSGAPITVDGTGLLARCLQHETDHLEGRLYIDRLSTRARKKVLKEYEALRAEREADTSPH
ncbi:peptide deformylase [Actinomadura pelletieri DSM 43383]|uniref:Peptide deformylase n=1 Tax=Actinomadura pelletieri DSM 43383 TaxID=1120940 RepID=A0A495QY60_9ACTN|nr:peptide deformylase [Actinomadura pelletieri]RKS79008.1 peptide deformylase [Actinomadura pelletieri DSM 43383]